MSYTLRPYQQEAVDLAIKYMRKNSFPAMLELATGSGKSIICAEIARIMTGLSGKKVLCLCPSSELVQQNHEKYLLTGNEASIYSASIGKSLRHDVVFATEGSFKSKALEVGEQYSTVILDECFHPDTLIKTEVGDIKVSDPEIKNVKIYCFNEETGMITLDYPVNVWNNGSKNVSRINTTGGAVECTNTHKFFSKGQWVEARDLKDGQEMMLLDLQAPVLRKLHRACVAVAKKLFQS